MNRGGELLRKWITPESVGSQTIESTITNHCLFVSKDARNNIEGLVLLQPTDINEDLFVKIANRISNGSISGANMTLFHPDYLTPKVKKLSLRGGSPVDSVPTNFISFQLRHKNLNVRTKLKVVNVDDSPVILKLLGQIFASTGWVDVCGQVSKSTDAVAEILRLNPDVVTLDIQMPFKTGVEVLKELLSKKHFPVLMVSSLALEEGSLVFEALNSGAFDYVQKPKLEERKEFSEALLTRCLLAIEGRDAQSSLQSLNSVERRRTNTLTGMTSEYAPNLVWCIGASTGGPQALTRVFTSLPHHIPPTLIVQHIPPVFSKAFADSLNSLCPFTVKEAEDGDILQKDFVYVAPGGKQMKVCKTNGQHQIRLTDDDPVNRFKPSVDYLFDAMSTLKDLRYVAGILTGMGRDGSQGLLKLKNAGAHTFAQDEASSAVYGMPRAASEIGAACHVIHIDQVATHLLEASALKKVG